MPADRHLRVSPGYMPYPYSAPEETPFGDSSPSTYDFSLVLPETFVDPTIAPSSDADFFGRFNSDVFGMESGFPVSYFSSGGTTLESETSPVSTSTFAEDTLFDPIGFPPSASEMTGTSLEPQYTAYPQAVMAKKSALADYIATPSVPEYMSTAEFEAEVSAAPLPPSPIVPNQGCHSAVVLPPPAATVLCCIITGGEQICGGEIPIHRSRDPRKGLRTHIRDYHPGYNPQTGVSLLCPWKDCSSHNKNIFAHVWNTHMGILHPCSKCNCADWKSKFALSRHFETCGKSQPVFCGRCYGAFPSKADMNIHIASGSCPVASSA